MPSAEQRDTPPRLAEYLLRLSVPDRDRDALVGDLAEEFERVRLPREGRAAARWWYWRQALRSTITSRLCRPRRRSPRSPAASGTGDSIMSQLLQDVRYGMRTLLKTPTFTVLTIVTLALAIGVNTAIFSMMNVLFVRGVPIEDPDTIAFVYANNPARGIERSFISAADYLDLRREMDTVGELSAVNRGRPFVMTGLEEPRRVTAFEATANTFALWGVPIFAGRGFRPGEDRVGAEPVAILAHGFWERTFAADPQVIGDVIELDGIATTVVGIMDPELEFGSLANAQLWTPLRLADSNTDRESRNLWVSGRLEPGRTLAQVDQEVQAIWSRLQQEHPEELGAWQAVVFDLHNVLAPPETWTIFYMLFLTVGFVLLIACSNVATMMLARSTAQAREIALRVALGAGRLRIVAQLVTESMMLSIAAGALGLLLARLCLAGLAWMAGQNSGISNFLAMLEIDRNVLLFTLGVSMLAPLVFGLLPALRASRPDLSDTLKEGTRGNSGGASRLRRFLVGVQVALALTLMVVAGTTIQSMLDLRATDLGFDKHNLLTLRLDLPESRYPEMDRAGAYFDEVQRRLEGLPGVRGVAMVGSRLGVQMPPMRNFTIEGMPAPTPEERPWAVVNTISQGAAAVLDLDVLAGREFDSSDSPDARRVAVINTEAATRFWPDGNAIGQRLRFAATDPPAPAAWIEIVGIVSALPTGDPANPTVPELWLPREQNPQRGLGLMIRTEGDPLAAAEGVRREIWGIDSEQPIADVRTMEQIEQDFLAGPETLLSMFVVFALFALAMAAAGIYGVMAFAVSQQTQEIGIRMALGARGGDVARMIARQAGWMVLGGAAVGSVSALVLGRALASAIAGTSSIGLAPIAGVVLTLAAAAAIATFVPTRRAIRIEPVIALRSE